MDNSIEVVRKLFSAYENDEYMRTRLSNYICIQLPTIMSNMKKSRDYNLERIQKLTDTQQKFIRDFLELNTYFYCSTTNMFFSYDFNTYSLCPEDFILHEIWKSIHNDDDLSEWKLSTKKYVIKRIRDNPIFQCVPESVTIQRVIDLLYPSVFSSRERAKYFLTILGDNILKKNLNQLIHLISPKIKNFLTSLSQFSQHYFGVNSISSFKYKYYEHEYRLCRIVSGINTDREIEWTNMNNCSELDVLCVAVYCSRRYESSDKYLSIHSNDYMLYDNVFYLKHRTTEDIVSDFCDKYLIIDDNKTITTNKLNCISMKNMQYLWKLYLDGNGLPNIMFKSEFTNILSNKIGYNTDLDIFECVSSKYLPLIERFLTFWNDTMSYDTDLSSEYELDELCALFSQWVWKSNPNTTMKDGHISEKKMLDLIQYYFPSAICIDSKRVQMYSSTLWNKEMGVCVALETFRNIERDTIPETISFYEIYLWYTTAYRGAMVVSKQYFEKTIHKCLSKYIVTGKKSIYGNWITDNEGNI